MLLKLPMPPSVNSIWRSAGRGRVYRSKRYKAWRTTAGWELKAQHPVPIAGWVRVTISLGLTKRRSDADNRIKVLLDSLVEHRLIEDDSKVAAVSVAWAGDVPPGRVRVEVKRARAPTPQKNSARA
jgi:Holliday junction resolvase RusA-like endonuclease